MNVNIYFIAVFIIFYFACADGFINIQIKSYLIDCTLDTLV